MKPNGKYSAVRILVLALCVAGIFAVKGEAQTTRGTFKLPVEAHWGKLVLAPGAYEFTAINALAGRIVTVRSVETGWSGMILASATSQLGSSTGTKLLLTKSEMGTYVQALCLGDSGVMLNYGAPKAGSKMTRLSPPQPAATMASASGAQ